jgi:hypothetical protein
MVREQIVKWLAEQKANYIASGKPLFLGEPDEWYEPFTVVCDNGHLSNRTLKSEALGKTVCLSCRADLHLCPNITPQELKAILDDKA